MKILVVPDVHQTTHWKQVISKVDEVDKVIFLGDYFDTHDLEPELKDEAAVQNLKDIIEFKDTHQDKVDLLMGNHDYHYLLEGISGSQFQSKNFKIFNEVLNTNLSKFKVVVFYEGWLFSHAGVSKPYIEKFIGLDKDPLTELNNLLQEKSYYLWYQPSLMDYSGTGNTPDQSPLWIRPQSLLLEPICNKQVVGHTGTSDGEIKAVQYKDNLVILTDSEEKKNIFLLDTKEPLPFEVDVIQ